MTNTNSNKFFFVINPNAGNECVQKEWPKIAKLISHEKFEYDFDFTSHIGHAEQMVSEKISEGFRKFVVVGGDGTLNEVINGIFRQNEIPTNQIYLGLFGMGTGNDWARYYNFTHSYDEALDRIKWGQVKTQDIGKIVYSTDNELKEAYFINIAGLCFDSIVVKATNKLKDRGRRSSYAYLLSLLKCLIKYRPWILKVSVNDEVMEGKFLSISIGNGKYSGGGMLQTPDAIINDGFLDVTVYPNMRKRTIVSNVNKLYNGNIYSVKGVKKFRTKNIKIESQNKVFAEIDGEIIYGDSYDISIIPDSINIFV